MRLGDLDELKKYAIPCETHNGALTELCVPLYQIDNALTVDTDEIYKKGYHNGFFATHDVPPTVEPTYISDMPDDKVKDLQELAIDYGEGIAVFERKRPQGEWKRYMTGYQGNKVLNITFECSECGRRIVYVADVNKDVTKFLAKYPFCNCGADMRKGEEYDKETTI